MRAPVAAAALASLLVSAAPARAHELSFPVLLRQDTVSKVGVSGGVQFYPNVNGIDFGLRFDAFGQYVAGLGGVYVAFPFVSHVQGTSSGVTSVGNVEVGGFFAMRTHLFRLTAGGSLVLGTAPVNNDGLANTLTALGRLADAVTNGVSGLYSGRIHVTFRPGEDRRFFWQLDLGVDFSLASHSAIPKPDAVVHLDGAVGVRLGPDVSLLAQTVWAFPTASNSNVLVQFSPAFQFEVAHHSKLSLGYLLTYQINVDIVLHGVLLGYEQRL